MASARRFHCPTCGATPAMPSDVTSTAWLNNAFTDSPPLRYDTPVILVPVRIMNTSIARCGRLPGPECAQLSLPGLALAYSTNCVSDVHGEDRCTATTWNPSAIRAIGAKFLTGS